MLVVEGEEYPAKAIATGLRHEAMAVDVVGDRISVLEQMTVNDYNIIVLDQGLPVVHGDKVCRRMVRDHPSIRVLMLTASQTLDARVGDFRLGADDYLTKPLEFPELVTRLRALRRCSQPVRTPVLEVHGMRLDSFRREVYRGGHFIHPSPKEFAVLQILIEAGDGVLSAETLLEKAWDANAGPSTNSMRTMVSRLRCKLGESWVIQTVPDVGYRFSA